MTCIFCIKIPLSYIHTWQLLLKSRKTIHYVEANQSLCNNENLSIGDHKFDNSFNCHERGLISIVSIGSKSVYTMTIVNLLLSIITLRRKHVHDMDNNKIFCFVRNHLRKYNLLFERIRSICIIIAKG